MNPRAEIEQCLIEMRAVNQDQRDGIVATQTSCEKMDKILDNVWDMLPYISPKIKDTT
jgi:hypothetical protein